MDLTVDDAIRLVKALKAEGVTQFRFGDFEASLVPALPVPGVTVQDADEFDPKMLGGYPETTDEEALFYSAGGR